MASFGNEDVRWFDVAMDDAFRVSGVQPLSGSVPIPVEKEKAYSPEKSVKEKARNLLVGGSGHRRNTPWRRLALLEKSAKRAPYERGWRWRFGSGCGKSLRWF